MKTFLGAVLQSHRTIWNLKNRPPWKEKLAALRIKIEHSDFADEPGFRSYRVVSTLAPAKLVNLPEPERTLRQIRGDGLALQVSCRRRSSDTECAQVEAISRYLA